VHAAATGAMNILAIDQGTSGTKALVVSPDGRVLGESAVPVAPIASAGGSVEQDPQQLLESVIAAGRQALEGASAPVSAVGLGNQGETVLCWDPATGRASGAAISWQDNRAAEVTRELAAHAARLEEITGLPLDPYFAAPKMTWLRRRVGDEGVITTVDAWINRQLTGETVTDAATASRTLLLDLDRTEWSEEACDVFGIDAGGLPRVADCAQLIGETDAFGHRVPVTGLAVDQQAALFAESCFHAGEAKCTYGTGAFILATAGTAAPRSRSRLAACVAWRLAGTPTYCLDGQIFTAGAAMSWLERLGLIEHASDLDRLPASHGIDPEAPIFVPALAGLGAPLWSPQARGGWIGLSLAAERDDLIRAVAWGIAAQVATLARAMADDLGRPLEALRVDGGLSRSATLMQAQADLLQAPVERYPMADATALGVGALARLGAGLSTSPADAVGPWTPSATFEPRITPDEAEEHLGRFRASTEALAGLAQPESRAPVSDP
jgi:glycerol kinase